MKGKYQIRVKNSKNDYTFELRRNLTILCGDSGKGKTTLYDMVAEYDRFGRNSGVSVSCDKTIKAISGADWKNQIESIEDSIIIIDEDNHFIKTEEFAETVRASDNYFLLITRNYLGMLPYSVDEIYEMAGRGKKKTFKAVYRQTNHIYHDPPKRILPFSPEVIITEDSRSGYQFFHTISEKYGIECVSAYGKSNIIKLLDNYRQKKTLVIADGAAFGCEIHDVVAKQKLNPNNLAVFLPESFEWIILNAGVVEIPVIERFTVPEAYLDSREFFSWERYFEHLLVELTQEKDYMRYKKSKLEEYYLTDKNEKMILDSLNSIKVR